MSSAVHTSDFLIENASFEHFKTLDSTNLEAKRIVDRRNGDLSISSSGKSIDLSLPQVITTSHQSKGRGRKGRTWISPDGGNIYMTILISTEFVLESLQPLLPLLTAISVFNAIKPIDTKDRNLDLIKFKWPNDLQIGGMKFGGILMERAGGFFVVGIGVNTSVDPKVGTGDISTSLEGHRLISSERDTFNSFARLITTGAPQKIISFYQERLSILGRTVSVNELSGRAIGIGNSGALIVSHNGKNHEVTFGDVHVIT